MEKSFELQPTFKLQKCSGIKNVFSWDHISQLPDEILEIIMSQLTMKEAARTSILSHRWEKLWTLTTGSLDFDGADDLWVVTICEDMELLVSERVKYVNWVNRILNSHGGATIDSFRIHFDLTLSYRSDIDSWIEFAIQKRVRRLEVNLRRIHVSWKDCYPFPSQYLDTSKINGLVSLNLNYVEVTREVVEYFLSSCPFLEFVRITNSPSLVGAKVTSASQRLKCLEILYCHQMEILEISDSNLRSLSFSGPEDARLCCKNLPNLAEVSLGGFYSEKAIENFHHLSISLSQIEILKMDLSTQWNVHFPEFPELKNVKELELVVLASDQHTLLSCNSMLKACPSLKRFSIWFMWSTEPKPREVEKKEGPLLKSLKVVELLHFRGSATDVELATYLFSNAPALEKISVETRDPYKVGTPIVGWDEENVTAKESVRQLAGQLSPGAELLVF